MVHYEVIDTTQEHIEELAETMAEADVQECWAASHHTPLASLQLSDLASSDTQTGLADGEVVCIFGVSPLSILSGSGSPWMLTSDLVSKHARVFARGNKVWMKMQKERWQSMRNHVDARNTRSIRWLKWMGFDFKEAKPFGAEQMPFHEFSWEQG